MRATVAVWLLAVGTTACLSTGHYPGPEDEPPPTDVKTYLEGCTTNADCSLVRMGCCGGDQCSEVTAVRTYWAGVWERKRSAACALEPAGQQGCSIYPCESDRNFAVCSEGRCLAQGRNMQPANCLPNEFFNSDFWCDYDTCRGANTGDWLCHERCATDADCTNPDYPYCSVEGLYAGSNTVCTGAVRICRGKAENDCRP